MLVLSRKIGESLWIGTVEVRVTRVEGDKIRLAFKAPPEVKILRSELVGRQTPRSAVPPRMEESC